MNRIRNDKAVKVNKMVLILIAMLIGLPIGPGLMTEARASVSKVRLRVFLPGGCGAGASAFGLN